MSGMIDLLPNIVSPKMNENSKGESPEQLKEACKQFEAVFIGHLLRCMKSTVPEGGLIAKSSGQKIFEEMLDDKISEEIAQTGTLGLGETLLRNLTEAGITDKGSEVKP